MQIPDKPTRQKIYRIINLFYGIYGIYLGRKYNDSGLILSGIILFLTDAILVHKNIYDVQTLQWIRLLAIFALGPYWIYKGRQYNNKVLSAFGLSFIIFDGFLFLTDLG